MNWKDFLLLSNNKEKTIVNKIRLVFYRWYLFIKAYFIFIKHKKFLEKIGEKYYEKF